MSADAPQPFRRQVQWSSLPKPVFRAGPLPSGGTLPPLPEPPNPVPPKPATARPVMPRPAGGGILNGSLIPQAPRPRPQIQPTALPSVESRAQPPVPQPESKPEHAPVPPRSMPDLSVRALPEPDAAEAAAQPTPQPLPSPKPVAARKPGRTSRLPLMIGAGVVASVAIIAGVWTLTRDGASDGLAVPPPEAPAGATTVPLVAEAVPLEAPVVPSAAPEPIVSEAPAVARTPPAQSPAATPVQRETQPPAVVAPPQIETAPLVEPTPVPAGPAPTTAERPVSDPDAPVLTRPQPLD